MSFEFTTGMCCAGISDQWISPNITLIFLRRLDTETRNRLVINQLTNDRYDHFHGHPSKNP